MTGLEPATSTVAWWHSTRIELHPRARQPLLRRAGLALVSIRLVYECTWGALFLSTTRCCNISHMPVLAGGGGWGPPYASPLLAGRT